MRAAQGTARGHRQITATHRKTLELLREPEIGPAASCVLAVGAQIDERQIAKLRGEVELRILAGGHSDAVRGLLNPAFRPGDPLIVRRAHAITRDAVMIGADRGAADVDRALVAALRDPGAEVAIELREVGADARSEARAEAATHLLNGVPGALIVDPGPLWRDRPAPAEEADLEVSSPLHATAFEGALHALSAGGRVHARLDLCADDRAVSLVRAAIDASHAVLPALGLPTIAASLAIAGVPLRNVAIEDGSQRLTRRLRPGCVRVAAGVRGDRVADWLAEAHSGVVSLDVGTPREQHLQWRAGSELQIPGGRTRKAIVVAYAEGTGDAPLATTPSSAAELSLDPALASFASEMLAHGASTRDVAHALQQASGLRRSIAYDAVLSLQRRAQTSSVERRDPRTSR